MSYIFLVVGHSKKKAEALNVSIDSGECGRDRDSLNAEELAFNGQRNILFYIRSAREEDWYRCRFLTDLAEEC